MTKDLQAIKNMLQREATCADSDDMSASEADNKLSRILSEADGDDLKTAELIRSFLTADEVQKRKLLAYCVEFFDPTERPEKKASVCCGEEVQLHKFLREDDLTKLCGFVRRHAADNSFGETVYKMIDLHGLTPAQVYKNAFLRRQDFARVTDPRCKNVTRLIAWQIAIGLHCSLPEADEVLFSGGYIRRKTRFDLVMEYFIENENYDIMAINDVLDELGIKPFSCYLPVSDKGN